MTTVTSQCPNFTNKVTFKEVRPVTSAISNTTWNQDLMATDHMSQITQQRVETALRWCELFGSRNYSIFPYLKFKYGWKTDDFSCHNFF